MRKMEMLTEKITKTKTMIRKSAKMSLQAQERGILIPDDIIFDILLRLPARSVGKFRCVSKSWLVMTSNRSFIRAHSIHSRGTHQSLILLSQRYRRSRGGKTICFLTGLNYSLASAKPSGGFTVSQLHMINGQKNSFLEASCDGLTFIDEWHTMKNVVVNPLTGHFIKIPQPKAAEDWSISFFCLYFHHSTSKYRLLRAVSDRRSKNYVLVVGGKSSWRFIPGRRPAFHQHPHPVDVNGSLHWLACKEKDHPQAFSEYKIPYDTVMTYDKETEVFSLLSMPLPEKRTDRGGNLMDFNKELGFWVAGNDGVIDVWIMEECWIKKYSIICADLRGCLGILKSSRLNTCTWILGNAVCIGDEELLIDIIASSNMRYLVRWNIKSGACVVQSISGYYNRVYFTFSYTQTLLSACDA